MKLIQASGPIGTMRHITLLAVILMLMCFNVASGAWPWQDTPKEQPKDAPAAVNPFEGKAFMQYPSSLGYMEILLFTSDSTGESKYYSVGSSWTRGIGGFTYTVRPEKKEIQITFNLNAPIAYNYTVQGRIVTLSNLNGTRELVEAVQPFFWQDGKFDERDAGVDAKERRQEAFIKSYIAEARKTYNEYTFSPEHLPLKERAVEAPAPTPAQRVQFLAIPVDESKTKYMLRNVSTGEFRDDRVFSFGTPQSPGQIVSFDGVSALIVTVPKTATTGTSH